MKRFRNLAAIILLALGFSGCGTVQVAHDLADIATLGVLGQIVPRPGQTSTSTRQRPSVEPQGGQKQAQLRRGTLTFTNSRYEGQLLNGKMHGQGTYTWASGTRHVGEFHNGKFTGRGTRAWANGNRYEGDWHDNTKHGQGTFTWKNGDRYVGDFRNDKRTGRGTFVWGPGKWKGHRYEGGFVDDKLHGQGTYTWPDGSRYEGDWRNDKRTGRGTRTWPNGNRYEGDWHDGKMRGRGIYTWANGNRYEGEFRDDKLHGQGTMTHANGSRHVGEWREGKRVQGQQQRQRVAAEAREQQKRVGQNAPRLTQAERQALERYRQRGAEERERHRRAQLQVQERERQRRAQAQSRADKQPPPPQRETAEHSLWHALAMGEFKDYWSRVHVLHFLAENHATKEEARRTAMSMCERSRLWAASPDTQRDPGFDPHVWQGRCRFVDVTNRQCIAAQDIEYWAEKYRLSVSTFRVGNREEIYRFYSAIDRHLDSHEGVYKKTIPSSHDVCPGDGTCPSDPWHVQRVRCVRGAFHKMVTQCLLPLTETRAC